METSRPGRKCRSCIETMPTIECPRAAAPARFRSVPGSGQPLSTPRSLASAPPLPATSNSCNRRNYRNEAQPSDDGRIGRIDHLPRRAPRLCRHLPDRARRSQRAGRRADGTQQRHRHRDRIGRPRQGNRRRKPRPAYAAPRGATRRRRSAQQPHPFQEQRVCPVASGLLSAWA